MGSINQISAELPSYQIQGARVDLGSIAQIQPTTQSANVDRGMGSVQGYGTDGKTVYSTTLIQRSYASSGETRFFANGKALPSKITDESAARVFVRQQIRNGKLGELPLGNQNAFSSAANGRAASGKSAQPKAPPQRLQDIPAGAGEVGSRDAQGNTLVTNLKARQVMRSGEWRNEGFMIEKINSYSAKPINKTAQPDPSGYGYPESERSKVRLITGSDGRVITDLAQARGRVSELLRNKGLTMTTDAQAQTAQQVRDRRLESLTDVAVAPNGGARSSTLVQWKPVIPLPIPIEKMEPMDRMKYMLKEAVRVAPDEAKKELQALLTPRNLALMSAFIGAQAVPIVNVMANGLAAILLGKDAIDTGGKVASAIAKGLGTKQPYELVASGQELSRAVVHAVGTLGLAGAGKAARGWVRKQVAVPTPKPAPPPQAKPPTPKLDSETVNMRVNPQTGIAEVYPFKPPAPKK